MFSRPIDLLMDGLALLLGGAVTTPVSGPVPR